jgi:sec-independent protein translocase protein TatB
MFGIGSTELLVILVVALLVLGPKNLPKIAHTLGRAMGESRRVSTEFQRTLNTEIAVEERKDKVKAEKAARAAEKAAAKAEAEKTAEKAVAEAVVEPAPSESETKA